MGRNQAEYKLHHIKIEGDNGILTAYTKKGKAVVSIFDANDVDKLTAFEKWRAVWQTKFDCQVIESKVFKDGRAIRTTMAAAILGCSPHAPIRHLNGDMLDHRRSNLDIYDVKAEPNAYMQIEAGIALILKDRYGRVVGEATIDPADLDLVIHRNHVWLKKRRPSGQPYVVNQNGLLLAHLLLGVSEGFVRYKNKNPLDNRRKNIHLEH